MHNGDSSDDQGWHCPPATGASVCSRGGRKHYRRQRSCNQSGKNSEYKSSNTLKDGHATASGKVNGTVNGINQGIQVNGFATNGFASLPEQGSLYIITSPAGVEWSSVNGLNGINGVSSNGNLYSPSCISESSLDGSVQCATMSANSALASPVQQALLATPIYNFELPNDLVGLLIGRHGAHVQYLEEITGASISVYNHASFPKSRLCAIEGSRNAINACLRMIRKRFPVRTFPHLKLHPVFLPEMLSPFLTVPVTIRAAEWQELDLVDGMAIETLVCFAYSPGHFFVHQPTHPSYMHLNQFQAMMSYIYERDGGAMPNLNPIVENTQCAAYCENGWYRAIVCELKQENGNISTALVKLLDCGGYFELPVSALKQLRVECTGFPIQANEIILQGVEPANDTDEWSAEAKSYFERLTESTIILTRVSETLPSGAKLSDVYLTNPERHSLAALLVDNGFAKFVPAQGSNA
ncbi:a kinase anchor protein [Trichuris trichiura]|uniref:A kinase anchor protein n=1 Tax=Trichuris trichiura TaxID=36087 RepID=A0A077ZC04_TRITR|nr:a kinase anchor protein [Trichuris trichiura]